MKDLILKRNKLRIDAMRLREVKFEKSISNKHSMELNKEQTKLWNKYKFYDTLLKSIRKEN